MKKPEISLAEIPDQDPADFLFGYFKTLFGSAGFTTGNKAERLDVIDLPGVQLQSSYRGLGTTALRQRSRLLRRYREERAVLDTLKRGDVEIETIPARLDANRPPLHVPRYVESKARIDQLDVMDGIRKRIVDVCGNRGLERFSVFIQPNDSRADLVVDHSYHLSNERDVYGLPRRIGSMASYPYLGPPQSEQTHAFLGRQRLEGDNGLYAAIHFLQDVLNDPCPGTASSWPLLLAQQRSLAPAR